MQLICVAMQNKLTPETINSEIQDEHIWMKKKCCKKYKKGKACKKCPKKMECAIAALIHPISELN